MSELRQNPATKQWVIISTERARRPQELFQKKARRRFGRRRCPFCPGKEEETPPEVMAYRGDEGSGDWQVRIFPNKFPALIPQGDLGRKEVGLFRSMEGVGVHEVLVESPDHRATLGAMSEEEVQRICLTYRDRYLSLEGEPKIKLIIVFKNYGRLAGTSLEHPHSQLVGTPIVPHFVRMRLAEAMRYYDDEGTCVYCDMAMEEIASRERIVLQTDDYLVIEPYASRSPFETWILPRRHMSTFGQISTAEAQALGSVLAEVMGKIYRGLKDPDYNYVIHTAPISDKGEPHYHWHLQIIPRLAIPAGFELGSGIFINTTPPEQCAQFLRKA